MAAGCCVALGCDVARSAPRPKREGETGEFLRSLLALTYVSLALVTSSAPTATKEIPRTSTARTATEERRAHSELSPVWPTRCFGKSDSQSRACSHLTTRHRLSCGARTSTDHGHEADVAQGRRAGRLHAPESWTGGWRRGYEGRELWPVQERRSRRRRRARSWCELGECERDSCRPAACSAELWQLLQTRRMS